MFWKGSDSFCPFYFYSVYWYFEDPKTQEIWKICNVTFYFILNVLLVPYFISLFIHFYSGKEKN